VRVVVTLAHGSEVRPREPQRWLLSDRYAVIYYLGCNDGVSALASVALTQGVLRKELVP
jgi:hypothetical protein